MIGKLKKKIIVWCLNGLGVLLIIIAPIIGPLPGPGGIPAFLFGLHLLSINNEWARRLKKYVETKSLELGDLLFPDNKKYQWFWDIFIFTNVAAGGYTLYLDILGSIWSNILGIILGFLVFAWFRNRHRWRRFSKHSEAWFAKHQWAEDVIIATMLILVGYMLFIDSAQYIWYSAAILIAVIIVWLKTQERWQRLMQLFKSKT